MTVSPQPTSPRERLERGTPEPVETFEIERDVERVPLAREPVVELTRDRPIGSADVSGRLVVTREADLTDATLGHDNCHVTERTGLPPQLHGVKLAPVTTRWRYACTLTNAASAVASMSALTDAGGFELEP